MAEFDPNDIIVSSLNSNIKSNPVPELTKPTELKNVAGKEMDPADVFVLPQSEIPNATRVFGTSVLRGIAPTASGLVGAGLGAKAVSPLAGMFAEVPPLAVGIELAGAGLGAAGASGITEWGQSKAFPVSPQEILGSISHPTATSIGSILPAVAMMANPGTSLRALGGDRSAIKESLMGGGVASGLGFGTEVAQGVPVMDALSHAPAAFGEGLFLPGNPISHALSFNGSPKVNEPIVNQPAINKPQTGGSNQTIEALDAALQATEPAPVAPVAPVAPEGPVVMPEATTPVAPSPSSVFTPPAPTPVVPTPTVQPGYAPPRPKTSDYIGATNDMGDAVRAWNDAVNQWDADYGMTHHADGRPLSQGSTAIPETPAVQKPKLKLDDVKPVTPAATQPAPVATPEQAPVTPEPIAQQPVAQPKQVVNPPASTEGGAIRNTDNIPVVRVNTAEIKADPKLMQYKATDEAATGVNAKDKLTGTWDDTKAGTLVVWQPENPSQYGLTPGEKYIVANGHHRLDFAQRAGRENLNVQILKESDGWSALDARRQAAEINIADGKGSPQDAVKYLQAIKEKSGDKAMEAAAKRIGSNEQARRNIDIAKGLTGEALDLFINEKIDANQARAIALHSPGDAAIQNAGAKAAVKGMKPETVVDVMNSIKSIRDERLGAKKDASEQTTMFEQMGWDVGKEQEIAEKLAMKVAEKRSAIDDKLAAVQSAAKRPEKAGAGGVKVENVEKTKAYIESLKAERDSLERWRDIPELKKQIYDEAGITRADEEAAYGTQPKAETQPKVETPVDTQTQIPGTSVEENYSMAGEKAVEPKTYAEMTPEEQLAYRNQNDTATGDMFGSYRVFEGDLSAQRKQKIAAEKEASDVSSLSDDANKILKQIPENSPHEDRFGTPMSEMNLDPSAIDSVADARDAIRQRADDIAPHYPEVAKQLREVLSPKEQPKVDRNPKTDARKADELDRRVDVNAANRAADSEARKGYQGIVDRAIFEARKNKNISEKEIQGLTRVLNYIGGRFFEGVKLSIKEGPESQMGQYDAANRIVTIFKDAIRTGRFEETAAHEVAHHLAKFLPEADRIALRKEWQSARDKYLKENPGFASLVGDRTADWNTVRIKGTDIQAAAKIYPDLNKTRYFTQIPGGKEPMFRIAATDEAYRLFNANEWFAETFKESARARLESDPTYTGEPKTWKDKLVGLWETIKTNFRQLFGKDQANKILSNFIKGKYVAEETSSPDVHAKGHETFNLSRDSIDNPSTVETEVKNNQKPEVSVGGKVYRSVSDAAPVKFFKSIATRMRAVASNNPQSEAVKQIVNDFALTPGTKGDAAKTDYNTDVSRQREVFTNRLSLALGGILKDVKAMTPEQRTRFNDLFVRAIEGRLPNEVGGDTGKAVKEVKAILEEMHQYGLDAGLEIGKVSEYFPRATNYDAVVADPEGFVKAAAKAYEMKWERQQKEASNGQTTMDLGAEAKPDFNEQARKWRDAILLGEEGIDFERGIFDEGKSSNVENFQKERVFNPQEAEQFDAFREKDIATLLSRYTGSLVRRAEVARRLGVKGEGWADAKKRMYEEGVSADDIKELEKSLKSNLGVTSVQLDPSQRVWMDANNLVVTAAYLRNTGLLNLVEPGAIGVRTGNALDTPRIMAQNLLRVRNVLARLTPAETKAAQTQIEKIYGKGHDIYSALALEMGLTSVHDGISSPSVGFHGDEGISSSGKMREAVDNIHRLYGIHATEVAKRETSLREGSRFIDKTISWALGENGMQKAFGLTKDTRLATDRLAELGINESEIPEFSKWVKDMRALDSDAQLQRIMDRNDPMAAKYRNALGVFSKQSVVQATSASKQIASKDTPLGRLFFQLSTYVNEWSSQQGRYLGETAKNIVGKNGYSGTERLMASGSLGAFALLSAGYYGLAEIRKLINGHKEKELKPGDYPHWVKDSADAVMYTGIAGPGEMVWKAIERGQMPAGVLGNMAGQSIKAAKEFADNPDSNAKQRNAAKLAYRVGVVPAVNTALAAVGGPIPAAAAQVVAGSRTERAVADVIAGEPPSNSAGVGPRPPQPHQPKPPRPGK